MGEFLRFVAFVIFSEVFLAMLMILLAWVYVWKSNNYTVIPGRGRAGYLVKALNWIIFAIALLVYPCFSHVDGRALGRIALSFFLLSEVAYQTRYFGSMAREVYEWVRNFYRRF